MAKAKKSSETRQRIIDAAMKLFRERGYSNVKVIDIVKASGIAHGSFYTYFKNKDALLGAYIGAIEELYYSRHEQLLHDPSYADRDPMEKIYGFLSGSNRMLANLGKDFVRAYNAYFILETDLLGDHERNYFSVLDSLLEQARQRGLIDPAMPNAHILSAAVALTRGTTVEWAVDETCGDISEKDHFLREFCLYISRPSRKHG